MKGTAAKATAEEANAKAASPCQKQPVKTTKAEAADKEANAKAVPKAKGTEEEANASPCRKKRPAAKTSIEI